MNRGTFKMWCKGSIKWVCACQKAYEEGWLYGNNYKKYKWSNMAKKKKTWSR